MTMRRMSMVPAGSGGSSERTGSRRPLRRWTRATSAGRSAVALHVEPLAVGADDDRQVAPLGAGDRPRLAAGEREHREPAVDGRG